MLAGGTCRTGTCHAERRAAEAAEATEAQPVVDPLQAVRLSEVLPSRVVSGCYRGHGWHYACVSRFVCSPV